MFLAEIWKLSEFLSENFHLLVVKFSVYLYLNRRLPILHIPVSDWLFQCGSFVAFYFVCLLLLKYHWVLSLFVPHLLFSPCLRKTVLYNTWPFLGNSVLQTVTNTFANSVGPDEMAHNDEPSHQDLHYLPFNFGFLNDRPICYNGFIQNQR